MVTLKNIQETLKKEKAKLRQLGILRIGIFGSIVRGEATQKSDVDVLLDLAEDNKLTYLSLIELENELSRKLQTKVDLVIKQDLRPAIALIVNNEVQYV